MADLTSKIQAIENHLVGLGIMPAADANHLAGEDFIRSLNKSARVLAGMLEMPKVQGYSPEFGQDLLKKLSEKTPEEINELKTFLKENPDMDLAPRLINGFVRGAIQDRLKNGGVPEEEWGQIKLGGLLPMIENAEQIVADLNEITQDQQVAQVQATVQAQVQAQTQSSNDVVLKAIGQEGRTFSEASTQEVLKTYVTKLQTDFAFTESKRYGAFSQEFSDHIADKISSSSLPAGYDAAQLQAFSDAMNFLRGNGSYIEPEEPMNVQTATVMIEGVLKEMAPQLNAKLEEVGAKTNAQLEKLPEGFIRDLAMAFKDLRTGGLLDQRVPEISSVDGIFDRRAQASLQGFLQVLGHEKFMDFPGENDWEYTPALAPYMLDVDKLKKNLSGVMSPEDLKKIEPMLNKERMGELVDALNFLYHDGRISREPLIDPGFNEYRSLPNFTERIFQQQIDTYKDTNVEMIGLLDSLSREYAGVGVHDFKSDIEFPDVYAKLDGAMDRSQLLTHFYTQAQKNYKKNGGSEEAFKEDLYLLVNTVLTLPFGDKNRRDEFYLAMQSAVDAAGDASSEKAAGVFAEKVIEGSEGVRANYDGTHPDYKHYYERTASVWKPGLQSLEITSGGKVFTARDVAQAYDNYHLSVASLKYRELGLSDEIDRQGYISFTDDKNQQYVSAIDKHSMVFTVEKINTDALLPIAWAIPPREGPEYNGLSYTRGAMEAELQALVDDNRLDSKALEKIKSTLDDKKIGQDDYIMDQDLRRQLMRDLDPGYRLVDPKKGMLMASSMPELFRNLEKPERTESLDKFAADQALSAGQVKAEKAERIAKEAEKDHSPSLSRPGDAALTAVASDVMAPGGPTLPRSEAGAIRNYAGRLYSAPSVIYPGDKNILPLLKSVSGQDDLRIGSYLGSSLEVSSVRVEANRGGGPMISYFDKGSSEIRVIAPPDYLSDPAQRAELKNIISNSGVDSAQFMRHIESEYPDLYAMVENHRIGNYGGRPRLSSEPLQLDDYWQFKASTVRVLNQLDAAYQPRLQGIPKAPRKGFIDSVKGNFNTKIKGLKTEWGNLKEVVEAGVKKIPGAAVEFSEKAADGLGNTADMLGKAAQRDWVALRRAAEAAPEGIVNTTTSIGSKFSKTGRTLGAAAEKDFKTIGEVWEINTGSPDSEVKKQEIQDAGKTITAPVEPVTREVLPAPVLDLENGP